MIKRIFILSIILITFTSGTLFSQKLKKFSDNETEYLEELNSLLTNTDKKNGKLLFEEFVEHWVAGYFTSSEKSKIIENSNKLLKKRARAFPHFENYLNSLMAFNNSLQDVQSQNNWNSAFEYMLSKRNFQLGKINTILKNTVWLLTDYTLYQSASVKWQSDFDNYTFIFENNILSVRFDTLDLTCYSKKDSISILNTNAVYYPLTRTLYGNGGKVLWNKVGFSSDSVYCTLNDYEIELIRSSYTADSVNFINLSFASEPMFGQLLNKTINPGGSIGKSYPRFISYDEHLVIKNIYKGIDFEGGFAMKGNKFIGAGSKGKDARLKIYRKDTLFFTAESGNFMFAEKYISGMNTSITFYIDSDSIFHPGLNLKLYVKKRELHLIRTGEGMSRTPFYNSYHMVDMDFEEMIWNIDHPKIYFNMIKGGESRPAVFESFNYFSEDRYLGLQGYDKNHPYITLAKYTFKANSREFYAEDYATYLKMPPSQVRQQLMRMSYLGVINYDVDEHWVTVRDRLFYYLKAKSGNIDYDIMSFISNPDKLTNATLSLITNNITIHGVPAIQLSDSQSVIIYPYRGDILLKKNRDFEFDGKVMAGLFDFYGKKFSFTYDQFQIDLENIDSLKFYVPVRNQHGRPALAQIKTVIQDVTGNLLIDKPFNKSGVEKFPEYPIFNSLKYSYAYYDKQSIHNGVYQKDDFYFQINPYSIDSLDDFSTQGLMFDGSFTSAGIFPTFDEQLSVRPDLSLGFKRKTPTNGYSAYGTKGIYKNEINLSNEGLRGNGELSYLTSTTFSNDFIYFPDSMNTHAYKFNVNKQAAAAQYPSIEGENVYIHWEPKQDELYAFTEKEKMRMYDNEVDLTGHIMINPKGMTGGGFMEFDNAELSASLCQYKANKFSSDSADFNLLTSDLDNFAFKTKDVTADVNFITRVGKFLLNNDDEYIELPPNKYICYMDTYDWYMDKEEIDMSVSWLKEKDKIFRPVKDPFDMVNIEPPGPEFISVHPLQDSLNFIASVANYKIRESLLTASNVRSINVADACVFPYDGIVYVEKKAIMRTLEDARIVADRDSMYHLIYDADVNIFGRNKYHAEGTYDYVDEQNSIQKIHFSNVLVDDSLRTIANGSISDSLKFTLNPNFFFRGDVKLIATKQLLTFTGSAKMNFECEAITNNWLSFSSEIDPLDVYIPVPDIPLDIEKNKLYPGMYITKDSTHIYTSFLNKKKKYSDDPLLSANGYLYFDNSERAYMIGSKEKIENPDISGNFLRLFKDLCSTSGEGIIDMSVYTGQIKIKSAGFVYHDLNIDTVDMNLMMVFDFFFPGNVLQMMADDMQNSLDLEPADLSSDLYIKSLGDLVGSDKATELISNLSLYGEYKKFPDELNKSLVLTEANFIWNTNTKSYVSYGQIGVGNIGKNEINRYVDGKIEFVKSRGGNEFTIYLQLDFDKWYYFEYKRNNLFVVSSDENFNFALKDMKSGKRRNSIKGEPPLNVVPASERKRTYFLRKFNMEEDYPDDDE